MTLEDYDYVVDRIDNRDLIKAILVIGGEPLAHPYYPNLIYRIECDFPKAKITVHTNGKLLPMYYKPSIRWVISKYEGWNDDIINAYKKERNVNIGWSKGVFWDPYEDPDFDEQTAKWARANCTFSVRILGRRLYSCCLSEPIERDFNLDNVSIPFTDLWRKEIYEIETWRSCQHCFRAKHLIENGILMPKGEHRHDK